MEEFELIHRFFITLPWQRGHSLHSVQFSSSVVSDSLQPHGLQHTRFPCPSPTPGVGLLKLMSIKSVMPSKPPHPLLSPSPPVLNLSQHQGLFQWVSSSHQVAKVLELQLHHQSFQILPFPFQPSSSSFHGASSPLQILNENIQDWLHTGKQFLWSTWPYPLQIYS